MERGKREEGESERERKGRRPPLPHTLPRSGPEAAAPASMISRLSGASSQLDATTTAPFTSSQVDAATAALLVPPPTPHPPLPASIQPTPHLPLPYLEPAAAMEPWILRGRRRNAKVRRRHGGGGEHREGDAGLEESRDEGLG